MSQNDKELDRKDQDTEDTDLEDENSEDDEDHEDDEDQDDPDDDEDPDDEDDDKPLTKKDLKEFKRSLQNSNNANRRVSQKDRKFNQKPPKQDDRFSELENNQKKLLLAEEKRQFGHKNNLSPEEVDYIYKLTKRPTSKTLKDPFVKAGLEGLRSNRNIRQNTPGGNGPATKFEGKDWNELDERQKQDNFADRRREILERKKNR